MTTSPSNTISKPASTTQLLTTISASHSSLSSSAAQSNITTLPTGSMIHNETLTSGAKAGIAIGVILGGIIVYMVAILCLKREIRREAAMTLIEKHKLALILSEKIVNENAHSDINLPGQMAELEAREIRNPGPNTGPNTGLNNGPDPDPNSNSDSNPDPHSTEGPVSLPLVELPSRSSPNEQPALPASVIPIQSESNNHDDNTNIVTTHLPSNETNSEQSQNSIPLITLTQTGDSSHIVQSNSHTISSSSPNQVRIIHISADRTNIAKIKELKAAKVRLQEQKERLLKLQQLEEEEAILDQQLAGLEANKDGGKVRRV